MIDIELIRSNPDKVKWAAKVKNIDVNIDYILILDKQKRELLTKVNNLRAERNKLADEIPKLSGEEKTAKIEKIRAIKQQISEEEAKLRDIESKLRRELLKVPNIPLDEVPVGPDDTYNEVEYTYGEIPSFDFPPKDHVELGKILDIIDIPRGVKVAGTRNYYLKNEGVLLELAVLKFTLDFLVKKGFTPLIVPHLVREFAMEGTGYFPWGKDQAYAIEKDELFLIGTSEVSLVAYHANEILLEDELPKFYAGWSACYRREAGTYGKDTKGVYRVHQFSKIEQVVLLPQDMDLSYKLYYQLLSNSEEILKLLGLPYRKVKISTGEMGAPQVLKHDLEVWMPSRNSYSETHSCSMLLDFQARRLNIRYKTKKGNKFVYTLNNTAIASPRILIPILEIYQQPDGSVVVPEVLRPYMGGIEVIKPKI